MRVIYLLGLAALLATACRSTKSIQTAMSRKDSASTSPDSATRKDSVDYMMSILDSVAVNRVDFNTFSAKIKVDFEGRDGKKNDFNANVRLKKDSVLWVSINALLGIEAFRIMITPDSVKVLNKLDKVVQLRSVNYLKEITRLPFTFRELQDVLMGNPIYLDSNVISYRKTGNQVLLLTVGDLFRHLMTLSAPGFAIQQSKLDDINPINGRSANISYGDYERKNNRLFSTFRKITVSEKSKLDIEMKYKQYEFNVPLNFPFSVPKNYKLQ